MKTAVKPFFTWFYIRPLLIYVSVSNHFYSNACSVMMNFRFVNNGNHCFQSELVCFLLSIAGYVNDLVKFIRGYICLYNVLLYLVTVDLVNIMQAQRSRFFYLLVIGVFLTLWMFFLKGKIRSRYTINFI